MTLKTEFADLVHTQRQKLGFTVEQLAEKSKHKCASHAQFGNRAVRTAAGHCRLPGRLFGN